MGPELDRRQPGNRLVLKLAVSDEPQPTGPLRDQMSPPGRKAMPTGCLSPAIGTTNLWVSVVRPNLAQVLSRTTVQTKTYAVTMKRRNDRELDS
jgi:hypothetical protein